MQILSGLEHLHTMISPLAHGDLTPVRSILNAPLCSLHPLYYLG